MPSRRFCLEVSPTGCQRSKNVIHRLHEFTLLRSSARRPPSPLLASLCGRGEGNLDCRLLFPQAVVSATSFVAAVPLLTSGVGASRSPSRNLRLFSPPHNSASSPISPQLVSSACIFTSTASKA